jgi:hypothetical protein
MQRYAGAVGRLVAILQFVESPQMFVRVDGGRRVQNFFDMRVDFRTFNVIGSSPGGGQRREQHEPDEK